MSTISNSLSSPAAQFLSLLNNPSSTTNKSQTSSTVQSPDSTSEISQYSQLLNKLQSLSQTDPTKFKSLTTQIASQLTTAASNTTGSESQFLNNLAGKFTQASQDGNISALQPQQSTRASGGHHHHHHHSGGGDSASAYNATTDPSTATQSALQSIFSEVQSA